MPKPKSWGLLLEARRFARATHDRLKQVHDATETYDLVLDESLQLSNKMLTWLDELIENEELKEAENE
jgi:hypothetical protein